MTIRYRRALNVLGGLAALLTAFHLEENWRGRRAWAAWMEERRAAGDPIDFAALLPLPVPDAENFFKAPRVNEATWGTKPLLTLPGGWPEGNKAGSIREGIPADLEAFRAAFPNGDLKMGLEAYRETLDDLLKAAQRPGSRAGTDAQYLAVSNDNLPVPNLLGFRAAARMLQLRATAAFREGRGEAGCQDAEALLRMVHHLDKEPILLFQLLHLAYGNLSLQTIWEGLHAHALTEAQLARLQGLLGNVDFLGSLTRSFKAERLWMGRVGIQVAEEPFWSTTPYPSRELGTETAPNGRMRSILARLIIPRGWIYQTLSHEIRAQKRALLDPVDTASRRIDPRRQDAAVQAYAKSGGFSTLGKGTLAPFTDQNIRAARTQTHFDQAWIACELERHFLAHHAYPDQLAELGVTIPADVIDGQPMRYHRRPDGGYVLYSVGWNGTDEGGKPGQGENAIREGDWTWIMPGGRK
jgi:hypothetical protein